MLFILFWWSELASGIIFSLLKEISLTFLVMNFFSFDYLKNYLFYLHFWKIWKIRLTVYFFQFLNMFNCLLACIVADEKFAFILLFVPLYIMCFYFLAWMLLRFSFYWWFLVIWPWCDLVLFYLFFFCLGFIELIGSLHL